MESVVEVTPYAGAADTGSLSFQIEDLAHHARLPEKPPIPPRALLLKTVFEVRDHAQTERSRSSDLLPAADHLRVLSKVPGNEFEERQMRRTPGRLFEEEVRAECCF